MKKLVLLGFAALITVLLSSCGPMWPWGGGNGGPEHHGGDHNGGGGPVHHGGGPGGGGFHGPGEGH